MAAPETPTSDLADRSSVRAAHLVFAARALRDLGDGFVAILLPLYPSALGLDAFAIGLVATVSLLGSALLTLLVGVVGTRLDQRDLLMWASALAIVTGLVLASGPVLPVILLIAFVGTVNPSAGSVSVFMPLEHSVLSRSVADADRTAMFARYSLIGALAAAVGALVAATPELLAGLGLTRLDAFRAMFALYAVLGLLGGIFYALLPRTPRSGKTEATAALGPSRGIVFKLAALFSLDSFAGGFAVQSLLALWLFEKFNLTIATAAIFFFWSSVLAAFSFPVAAWLARRIGLVNTMVYTHIPSSVCLILAAVAPTLHVALGLLLLRAALSQMDVPTRSSYVMAVVTPPERPAAASFTSVPRSLASALSPALAGALFAAGYQAWPLILCGLIKIIYDVGLLWMFRHVKPPEEQ